MNYSINGLEWTAWKSEILGNPERQGEFPVYVQKHALDRLYGPNNRLSIPAEEEYFLHFCMCVALSQPKVHFSTRRSADEFLCELWVSGHKLGYLAGTVADKVVVIKTFLFLTMDGTPEGSKLWERLRLRRADKEYLQLDWLRTFGGTKLRADEELVALLTECGCGHLFRIPAADVEDDSRLADDIRRYLEWLFQHPRLNPTGRVLSV